MTHRFESSLRALRSSLVALTLARCAASPTTDAGADREVSTDASTHEDGTTDSATIDVTTDGGVALVDGAFDTGDPFADGAPRDAPSPQSRVGVFVAQGYVGRTMISCDDGRTWIANRSDDDGLRCFTGGVDCDHNGGRAMGIAALQGALFATWGWGAANSVRRSTDGVRWERVLDRTIFSGIESGADRVVAIANEPQVTTDLGARWTASTRLGFIGHIRATGVLGARRFVAAGGENGASVGDVMISDDGVTWRRPASVPRECGQGVVAGGIGFGGEGDGIAVMTHDSGLVCISRDLGQRWTSTQVEGVRFEATVLHTGSEFVTWGRSMTMGLVHLRSADGARWTATALTASHADGSRATTPRITAAARSPSGSFVTAHNEWNQWYERQLFYRSTDGIRWQALPAAAFVGSHPVRFFIHTELARGACP
jgi:hypothetical protein